ncbi:MAG: hypothetical protein CMK59_06650 [Proteobacteria bacterium]|nr:hypothetical protein [Pseudomonadota bacterium]
MLAFWGLLACRSTDTQSFEYSVRDRQDQENATQNSEDFSSQDTGFVNSEDNEENRADDLSDVEDDVEQDDGLVDSSDNEFCGSRVVSANIGDCAENFSLPDQTGSLVSLHDFAGDVIFIDLSSFT